MQGAAAASAPIPDLTKELRNTSFPIVHLLLRTGLQELVSTKAPQAGDLSDGAEGWMYLYDGKVENYKDSAISWVRLHSYAIFFNSLIEPSISLQKSNKMNLKLVVRNRNDASYKLKNKKEEGDTVMRRQTWHEEAPAAGRAFEWRKHEYKLVKQVNYYRQMPDGAYLTDAHTHTHARVHTNNHHSQIPLSHSLRTGDTDTGAESAELPCVGALL